MKFKVILTVVAVCFCSMLNSSSQEKAKDDLGSLLKSTGWDALIGTWLNPAGDEFTFAWQFPGTALRMEADVNGVKRCSVYVKRAKSDVANAFAYDSGGGSNFGTCTFSKGVAHFVMRTTPSDASDPAEMKFQYILTSDDTFEVKMEGGDHVYKYTRK